MIPTSPPRPPRTSRRGFTLIELLLPAVQAAREAARRSQCVNNLKQLALVMANYDTSYAVMPL
jgi:hypothetical protein